MKDTLKLAVISDLHCRYTNDSDQVNANTYLISNLMRIPAERNPVEALKTIILKEKLTPDFLLCPGDITDKTDKQGLISGWQHLEDLKGCFNARILAATIGNHDVDSRKKYSSDPFDLLRRVAVNFPTDNLVCNQNFWASNYCILQDEECDLLIFNSSFSHLDKISCNQSNIPAQTIAEIEKSLEPLKDNGKLKIAMCHHHPIKHSNTSYLDNDSIERGDEFIMLLDKFSFTLVIHGHKHDPRITKYQSVPVFCAGSFSSMANLNDLGANNTFHFIEINKITKEGTIKSWVYGPKEGWQQKSDTYFPCHTGFGASVDIEILAKECIAFIKSHHLDIIKYEDLLNKFPKLKYIIPAEQIKLNTLISTESMEFIPALPNLPRIVSKQYI